MRRLSPSFFKLGDFKFGIYPEAGEVSLRLSTETAIQMNRLRRRIQAVLGASVYSYADERIESAIGRRLSRERWTLSVAESCTGGEISDKIVSVPGASRYFAGSLVTYDDRTKIHLLGVPEILIRRKGAASREVARAMARKVRERFKTTFGAAVTGIAGPTGGTAKKPVGLVYLALASKSRTRTWKENFFGDREQIKERAAKKLLERLWQWLKTQN